MKWGDLREIAGALFNATGAPLESSFSVLSPLLRPDKPFASGCFTFDPKGFANVEPRAKPIAKPTGYYVPAGTLKPGGS